MTWPKVTTAGVSAWLARISFWLAGVSSWMLESQLFSTCLHLLPVKKNMPFLNLSDISDLTPQTSGLVFLRFFKGQTEVGKTGIPYAFHKPDRAARVAMAQTSISELEISV